MMETVLENLTPQNQGTASPDWHQDLLLARDKALKNEQDNFVDWHEAKKQILKQVGVYNPDLNVSNYFKVALNSSDGVKNPV